MHLVQIHVIKGRKANMDVLGTLSVRFHFNGEFISAGKKLFYSGGREQMSYIDRDKVSLPEIVGHLKIIALSMNELCCIVSFLAKSW